MEVPVLRCIDCQRELESRDLSQLLPLSESETRQIALEENERKTGELPPELRERAFLELGEEPAIMNHGLAQMRHFIEKHDAIKSCRTDNPYLLRFLRTAKYSVPEACSMLERYLTIRQMHPQWFNNLDPLIPKVAALLDAGYMVLLPQRDADGRRVILSAIGRCDPNKFDTDTIAKVHSIIVESILDEPRSQLLGYTQLVDGSCLQMIHFEMWSIQNFKTMLDTVERSIVVKHRFTHKVNVAHLPFRNMEREMRHRNSEELVKHMDPAILPKEYGGTVSLRLMIEQLKLSLLARREELLALDDMRIELHTPAEDDNKMIEDNLH